MAFHFKEGCLPLPCFGTDFFQSTYLRPPCFQARISWFATIQFQSLWEQIADFPTFQVHDTTKIFKSRDYNSTSRPKYKILRHLNFEVTLKICRFNVSELAQFEESTIRPKYKSPLFSFLSWVIAIYKRY